MLHIEYLTLSDYSVSLKHEYDGRFKYNLVSPIDNLAWAYILGPPCVLALVSLS